MTSTFGHPVKKHNCFCAKWRDITTLTEQHQWILPWVRWKQICWITLRKLHSNWPLTHSLTHTFIHSFIHLHTHSHTHSLTHSLTHSPTQSVTHSIQHSPSSDANRLRSSQEIPRSICNPKVHYRFYKCRHPLPGWHGVCCGPSDYVSLSVQLHLNRLKGRNIRYKVQTVAAIKDMRWTKANFFRAKYPRQSRNKLTSGTAYSSKGAVTRVLATERWWLDSQQGLNFLF